MPLHRMSDFKFHCPHCRQRLQCDERLAGRRIVCPKCQQQVVIPQAPKPRRPMATGADDIGHGAPRTVDLPPAPDAQTPAPDLPR